MADFARGQLLTSLREARHLSQEDAAHEIGVTTKSLRAWEHGGKIRWHNAQRAAAFYGVDPERLVSRTEAGAALTDEGRPTDSQLDRMEAKLDAILNLLAADPETELDEVAADLLRAAAAQRRSGAAETKSAPTTRRAAAESTSPRRGPTR